MANTPFAVRLPAELKARIEAVAKERGVTASAVVLPILEREFAEQAAAASDPLLFRRPLPSRR